MTKRLLATTGLEWALFSALAATPVLAQSTVAAGDAAIRRGEGQDQGLGDIVVTAERRETSLQRTPIAVTALDAASIADRDIKDLGNLSGQVPGLISPGLSSQRTVNVYYIRGIGEADTAQNPSVGIYIDDVYIPRAWGAVYEIPDIAAVEVLRGPQGTLFGRNTSAGLISIKTTEPGATPRGFLTLAYGAYDEVLLRGNVNGPLSGDTLGASLSYVHHTRDGYTWNPTLDRHLNKLDTNAVRGKLKWTPSAQFSAEARFDYVADNSDASVYAPLNQPNGAGGSPYDPDKTWVSVYPEQQLRGGGGSVVLTYTPGSHVTLKSITAIRSFRNGVRNVNDGGTSYIFNESFTKVRNHDVQQELQALYARGRFHAVGGFFFLDEHYNQNRVVWSGGTAINTGNTQYILSRTHVRSYAGYAQLEYEPLDGFFLTGGLRYSKDDVDFSNNGYTVPTVFDTRGPQDAPATRPATAVSIYGITAGRSWDSFTPKVEAHYQWTPDIMTYLSYSKGFKAGGFDVRAATAATASQPFNPEKVDSFEGGFKSTFFGRHLRTNLAVFWNDFRDLQITAYDAPNFIYRRINAAGARTKGVEVEASIVPFARFQIDASIAYLDAKYTSFASMLPSNAPGRTTLKGLRLYFAPEWTQNFTANYTVPLGGGGLRLSTSISHRSSAFTDIYDTPQLISPAQYLVNAGINWTDATAHWQIGIVADNLFNNRENQGGSYSPSSGPSVLRATGGQQVYANNPPRLIRGTVGFKF